MIYSSQWNRKLNLIKIKNMKKIIRTLDFYEYDDGCVTKEGSNFTKDDEKLFPISDVVEIKNMKYILTKKEEEEENNDEESTSGGTETQG